MGFATTYRRCLAGALAFGLVLFVATMTTAVRAAEPQTPAEPEGTEEPRLSDAAELDRVIELYMAGEYAACTRHLSVLLDPESTSRFRDPVVVERGHLYFASCALLAGERDRAKQALVLALKEDPLMASPDSLTFPPPLVSLFLEARDEVQQLISKREQEQLIELQRKAAEAEAQAIARRQREVELRRLAEQEVVVERNSRWVASLPFGAGQFQAGKTELGALFLVTQTLALGTMAVSGLIYADLGAQAALEDLDKESFIAARDLSYGVFAASSWTMLGLVAVGVLEAHLTFEPERVVGTRRRSLPPELTEELSSAPRSPARAATFAISPTIAPLPGGACFGASGRF